MGRTLTEKIIAAHTDDPVEPGAFVSARVDTLMLNDASGPHGFRAYGLIGNPPVFDPERVVLSSDHNVPAKDEFSARAIRQMQDFARTHGITHHYGVGFGIAHLVMVEQGLVLPGDLLVGGDSHTTTEGALGAFSTGMGATDLAYCLAFGEVWLRVPETVKLVYHGQLAPWTSGKDLILHTIGRFGTDGFRYKTMELTGPVIEALSVSQRLTMCNMGIEAGAKATIVPADDKTMEYVAKRAKRPFTPVASDPDANFEAVIDLDVSGLGPQVACPSNPGNVKAVEEVESVRLDQVYVGSCTNTKIDDLRVVAQLLRGRTVHPDTRMIITPGTRQTMLEASKEGLLDVFLEAGATVGPPTCGACFGGHMGLLADGEVCLATNNRNFPGRMGAPDGQVYLANPAVAAASAVLGRIAHPREVVGDKEVPLP